MPRVGTGSAIYYVMANETEKFDPKLEEGIAYFEKMLELTPDDRVTLEFLCVAYGQIGKLEKQRRAFVTLAGVLLKEKDFEAADKLIEKLEKYSGRILNGCFPVRFFQLADLCLSIRPANNRRYSLE